MFIPKGDVYCCSIVIILTLIEYNKQVQKNRLGGHHASDHVIGTTKCFAAMLSTRPKNLLVRTKHLDIIFAYLRKIMQ